MARAKSKKKAGDGFWQSASGRFAAIALLLVGGSGVVAFGLIAAYEALEARAAAHLHEGDVVPIQIAWPTVSAGTERPESAAQSWLSPYFQQQLQSTAERAASAVRTDRGGARLREVSGALGRSGWFEGLPRVSRTADGLEVAGVWRVPAAVVRHGGVERLIAWDGRPLPVDAYATGESGRVFIDGVRHGAAMVGPEVAWREPWPGVGVPAGLELLRTLPTTAPWRGQVAGVDVSGLHDRRGLGLVLVTTYGTRVVWGASPEGFRPGEVSTAAKLARLDELFQRWGRIDGGQSRVDIFPVGDIVVERGTR